MRREREIVELHRKIGIYAERVPLSGAAQYQSSGHDVDIYPFGKNRTAFRAEVKGRADGAGFTMLERWLADYDLLFLIRDRQEPLVVIPWQVWSRLVGVGSPSIDIRPGRKNGHVDTTCAEHEGSRDMHEPPRGEKHEHPDKP